MNTSERELLELAAKAAGIEGEWVENSLLDDYYKLPTTGILTWSEGRVHIWNSRTSSGDAFRLAVQLGFDIDRTAVDWITIRQVQECLSFASVLVGDDPYASMRLAITKAAAEIGKDMK